MATSEANNITEGDAITTKPTTATAAGSVTDDEQSQEAVPIKKNSSILKKDSNIGNDEGDVKLPKKMSSLTIVGGDSKTTDDGVGDGDEKNNDEEDTKRRRTVSFSKLEIIEFLIQIGDNPSCEGAPLCISNECQKSHVLDVNEFEASRKHCRRHRKELVISASKRSRLLMQLGYSMEQIATAALETQKARMERIESLENKKWDKFNSIAESAKRKLWKIIGKTKPQPSLESYASRSA